MQDNNFVEERKYFNQLWIKVFIGSATVISTQIGCIKLINKLFPVLEANATAQLLITMLPMMLIGYPIFIYLLKTIPVSMKIEEKKMTGMQIFLAFFMSFGLMWAANLVGTGITNIISKLINHQVDVVLESLAEGNNIFVLTLFVAVAAPLFEEYIFRKLIIDRVIGYGEKAAILLAAFMFALFHGNLGQGIYAFFLGVFLGFIYVRTGKIRYTMILHMLVNLFGTVIPVIARSLMDFNQFMELSASGDAEGLIAFITEYPAGMVILLLQTFFVYICLIVGLILFIVSAAQKKFYLVKRENDLPKGKVFSVSAVNVGMLLNVLFMGVFIIMQLFGISIG